MISKTALAAAGAVGLALLCGTGHAVIQPRAPFTPPLMTLAQAAGIAPFVGTWTGQVSGQTRGAVEITVWPDGRVQYYFNGTQQSMLAAAVQGNTLKANFFAGFGFIELVPAGPNAMRYSSQDKSGMAHATLNKR